VSPAYSATPSFTAAPAISPGSGPLEIGQHVPVPSPWHGSGPARLALEMKGASDGLTLKVYTPAMACVGRAELGAQARGWVQVALPDDLVRGLPGGVYYYSLQARRGAAQSKTVIGVWMVLR
jgi:hypothetical protein